MLPCFSLNILARPVWLCGYRLLPMQIGHAALLDALGSPFLHGGDVGREDLIAAVWVCSRPATVAMNTRPRWWQRPIVSARLLSEQSRAFSEYVETNMSAPRRAGAGGGMSPAVPWQYLMAHRVAGGDLSKIGEAWNAPLLSVTCWHCAEDQRMGDTSMVNEDMERASVQLRLMRRQEAANG